MGHSVRYSNFFFIVIAFLKFSIPAFADQANEKMEHSNSMEQQSLNELPIPSNDKEKHAPVDTAKSTHKIENHAPVDLAKSSHEKEAHTPVDTAKPNNDIKKNSENDLEKSSNVDLANHTNVNPEKRYFVGYENVYCRFLPLSLSHTEGHWLDNNQGYSSINLFWPFEVSPFSSCLPFLDLRVHVFNNGKTGGNLGVGFRMINDCNRSTIFGINTFYDFRKATRNRYFHQLGLGFEILNPCFDFRLNGYLPLSKEGRTKISCFHFGDGFKACKRRRNNQTGFNAEIGKWIVRDACGYFDFYAAVGIYSYFPKRHGKNIFGSEIRLTSNLIQYFSLELRAGYDRVNSTQAQGKLTVNIPFGDSPCQSSDYCCLSNRLCQPIHRQEIIYLREKKCCCHSH